MTNMTDFKAFYELYVCEISTHRSQNAVSALSSWEKPLKRWEEWNNGRSGSLDETFKIHEVPRGRLKSREEALLYSLFSCVLTFQSVSTLSLPQEVQCGPKMEWMIISCSCRCGVISCLCIRTKTATIKKKGKEKKKDLFWTNLLWTYQSAPFSLSWCASLSDFLSFICVSKSADRAFVPRWLCPLVPHEDQLHVRSGEERDNRDVRLHCLCVVEG